jgi:death-on-curing protein
MGIFSSGRTTDLRSAVRMIERLPPGARSPGLNAVDIAQAAEVIDRYRDLELGLADASLVVLLAAAGAALGRAPEVRDIGLLEAAAARPQATAFGEDAYPDLDRKAVAHLHSIVAGHSLVDGNKRLGWVAVRLFYRLNGTDIRPADDDAFALITAGTDGGLEDVGEIALRLRAWRP